ncbi:hypothetical protein OQH60_06025 [Campylobacter sp. MIT 21-1685]|uniref:hypothetical protein n=1 Tax=unclassified Campylobacter TaxID=2593542 RepID=UPI00224AAC2E|nr:MULTISPECIES: hypothetical protein [unclassified Campylobacter]MCX2683372.1 hypothetical protein [Campylobacter sp. MIT 21-1684]MCX2751701.1 hypothetical protein [Campylobacter sp. MIT 21-1682]MCX2807903.1 hypothetical protein [Campylobacter sp. MIT 21-1685]
MKKLITMVCLLYGVCFADSYKNRLNDGIEIAITHLNKKEIAFEFKQDNKILLSGKAVDKYSEFGLESNEDEEGKDYLAIEYWNVADECLLSFRIQCKPADENDTKTRLRIVGKDAGQKCKKYNELEDVIFFKQ